MRDEEENIRFIECCDDRFEIIKRAREHIIDATNIESRPEEMQVLDNFLFRCWQMGWLKNDFHQLEKENEQLKQQIENYQLAENESKEIIAELKEQNKIILEDNDTLNQWVDELKAQIEKMKNIIYEEVDFCSYCPYKDCKNDEGVCPCANISKEEQVEILTEWITKNRS